MAIVAHMDDGEIHCGGTLRKFVKRGDDVTVLVVTNGNKGSYTIPPEEITRMRREEQKEASRRLGEHEPMFLDYEDDLLMDSQDLRLDLVKCIRKVNPRVILTHSPEDGSPDHATVAKAVMGSLIALPFPNIPVEAAPMAAMPQVFFFDPSGGIGFIPEVYVDITDEMEEKMHAFKAHKSQTDYDPRYLEGAGLLSRFRGFQAGYKFAEAFSAYRFFGFMPDYRILP
jgi:LmbE family N-acetylglucosaminyl deacetylase